MINMTSSAFINRQHSTTGHDLKEKKTSRQKYRRWSSVDEQDAGEIENKEKVLKKVDPVSSDNDSGIEDSDQQVANSQTNQVREEEEENIPTFEACEDDENVNDHLTPTNTPIEFDSIQQNLLLLLDDLALTKKIFHETKKEFCFDTSQVFHAEFARLISCPISLNYVDARYYLFVEDGVHTDPCFWPNYAYMEVYNAKAQFKCPNPACAHLWTSMRARISFKISYPHPQGFVVMKILGQNCNRCTTPADALWYMEEVCRVMENLSRSIFAKLFLEDVDGDCSQDENTITTTTQHPQRLRHDPKQRPGKMRAPHNSAYCEACRLGLCFY